MTFIQDNLWFNDDRNDDKICMSSRVRFARNFRNFNFVTTLNETKKNELINRVKDLFFGCDKSLHDLSCYDFLKTRSNRLYTMFENYSVSMDFLHSTSPRCLLLSGDASSAIMINEEDHLRIQCYTIGNQIKNAFIKANFLDDFIDKKLDYAFDNKLGFLTTCPTNLGTGLRASYMFHLPMLERSPVFHDLLPMLSKLGMTIRGLHGEGSDVYGSIYQISNQTTLGISESEIIENLESFAKQIVEQENQLRIYDMNLNRTAIEDKIFRSFGILSHCRTIEFREAMELISNIKLARFLGVDIPKFKSSLHNIIIKIQPGHLNLMAGKVLDKSECLRYRADVIRQEIK